MALTSLSISPTLNNASANISVIDNTDYAAQGYTAGVDIVQGYLKVELTTPSGSSVVYDNTVAPSGPDIVPFTATNSQLPIPLPQDTKGHPLPGIYVITYRAAVLDSGFVIVDDFSQSFTYELDYTYPEVCLATDINCQDSKITSYDQTDYGLYSTVSRVHTLYPPPASQTPNIVGSQAVLTTTNDIYTKTWTQGVSTTVSYAFPDGLGMILNVVGTREFEVVCNTGISTIFCCVKKVFAKWNSLRCKNEVAYNNMTNSVITPLMGAMLEYQAAVASGNFNSATVAYNKIVEFSGCDGDCGCSDDSPEQVYPTGSSANFVVDSPDASINVTPEVNGQNVTYHIQVSQAIQNTIANLYARTITTGTPSYIQLLETGAGSNRNTEINFLPSALIAGAFPFLEIRYEITAGGTGGAATVAKNNINQAGNMVAPAVAQTAVYGGIPNVPGDIAIVRLIDFIAGGSAVDYTAKACVMGRSSVANDLKDIEAEIWNFDPASTTGVCDVRLYNTTTGQALTVGEVNTLIGTGTLYISLNITFKPS